MITRQQAVVFWLPANNQTISGIERRLTATVDGSPEQVLALSIEVCNGTALSPPQAVTGNFPYPVGIDPIDNSSVVEFAIETNAIAQIGDTIRFYFTQQTATDDDLLDLTLSGAPILFSLGNPITPPVTPVSTVNTRSGHTDSSNQYLGFYTSSSAIAWCCGSLAAHPRYALFFIGMFKLHAQYCSRSGIRC